MGVSYLLDVADNTFLDSSALDGSYASVADLDEISIPENAGHDFGLTSKVRHLRIAFGRVNSILGQRFNVPLQRWSETVVWAQCEIAFAGLMAKRGHDPEAKTESTVGKRLKAALDWLNEAKEYEVTPDPLLQAAEPDQVGIFQSDTPRGWNGEGLRTTNIQQFGRGGFFTDH